jgi:hypothetical protein
MLENPRTKRVARNLTAVFDTGCPWVLVHRTLVDALGLEKSDPPEIAEIRCLGGPSCLEPLHDARLIFPGKGIPAASIRVARIDVHASDASVHVVIGREVLDGRALLYDGSNGVLVLVDNPPRGYPSAP